MGTDVSAAPSTDGNFWDGYLEAVRAQGVKAPYDRWYVIRAEQYLKRHPDTVSSHRSEEVSAYLAEIGTKGGLRDWQFRQVVEALEALFCKVVVAPGRVGSTGCIGRTLRVRWSPITPPSRATYRYRR